MRGGSKSGDLDNLLIGLAWMGEASTAHIRRLWMPTWHEGSVRRVLRDLQTQEYLERRRWAIPQVGADGEHRGALQQGSLWSLSKKGRDLIRDQDTYPPISIAPRHRKLLPHDTQTYELIVRMIELARPLGLSGVYMEREVRLDPPRRRPIMDALLSFRFGGGGPSLSTVPWTKDRTDTGETRRRYAIENDRDSEPFSVIKGKADAYIAAGNPAWFQKYQKPFPLPVWLVPSETRLRGILNAWQQVWPTGRWLMTTDAWLQQDRWVYYQRGTVTERPLYRKRAEGEETVETEDLAAA